jgi:hypothetical protein
MEDSGSPTHGPPSSTARRKRVRKGTRSCWECKRRKNRCIWSRAEGNCDSCRGRGTRCIGQEFPEPKDHVVHERHGSKRLDNIRLRNVEALVEEMARKVNARNPREAHTELLPDDTSDNPQALISGSSDPNVALLSSEPSVADGFSSISLQVPSNDIYVRLFNMLPHMQNPINF